MKALAVAIWVSAFAFCSMIGPASAQTYHECEAKAVSKTKRTPLTGVSKTSSINKCMQRRARAKLPMPWIGMGKSLQERRRTAS
jgi:hypothetical protein